MKTKSIYQGIALLTVALTTAACQNELKEDTTDQKPAEKVNMTIRATQGTAPQTRTDYEDKLGEGTAGSVVVKWEGGTAVNAPVENIKVFGYATTNADKFTDAGTLSSTPASLSNGGLSIDFSGSVEKADDYLAVYPADNCEFDGGYVYFDFFNSEQHQQKQDCTAPMAHLKKFDIMIGKPATTGTNNYTFSHKAIMLRFDLNLPKAESVNKITLNTTGKGGIAPSAYIMATTTDKLQFDKAVPEVSLDITNHTTSTTLKAYMMVPSIDVGNATLTITVATTSGNTYEGKLTTTAGLTLEPGLCYTLRPNTLTLTNKITVPPVAEGELGNALKDFIPDAKQTNLAVTGTVNETDIAALASFLKETKSENITILDLSGITITNSAPVTGFKDCIKVIEVILPDYADAIGDNAFEGCTALTTVTQTTSTSNPNTRASMPSRVKTVGKEAFKGCTAMTEMFLHNAITKVGDNAFAGCTALRALVFEGTRTVSTETGTDKINLGANILDGCTKEGLNILLPYITETEATKAATYKKALGKPTRYSFLSNLDYSEVTNEVRLDSKSYKATVSDGSSLDDFKPGAPLGQ